jgi:hypothetical protein
MRFLSWMAVLLVGVLLLGAWSPAAVGEEAPKPKPALGPKWEYRVLAKREVAELGKKDLAAGLNKLGDEGWELVAVEPQAGRSSGQPTYYFKRLAARAESGTPGEGDFRMIKLKNASAADVAKVLHEVFGADVKRTRIAADPVTNTILVKASDADLLTITKIVEKLDVPAGK